MCSCLRSIARCILILVNTIFFLAGSAALSLGLYIRFNSQWSQFFDAGSNPWGSFSFLYFFIGIGAYTMLIGMLGCCGGASLDKGCLYLYLCTITIALGLEIAIAVMMVRARILYLSSL